MDTDMQITDCWKWYDEDIKPGSVVHDDHGEQFLVIKRAAPVDSLIRHVLRTRDGAVMHPAWMAWPVGVSGPGQNLS